MNTQFRFTKVAVAAGLVVTSGAAVLGITGFASARLAPNDAPAVVQSVATDSASTADGSATTADDGASTGSAAGSTAVAGDVNAAASEAPAVAPADGAHAPISRENLAKVLGLTVTELDTQVRSGKSLADIAKAQNVDIQKVKDVLVADFTALLDAEVKAGEHTQAEADAKLVLFKGRLDDMVNGVRPAGGPGMGGKGGHGPGGRHGHGPMGDDHGAPGTEGAGFSA
ncbi:MAG: hypothetical protein ACKOBO_04145 [Acidimicrobiales bacterium]